MSILAELEQLEKEIVATARKKREEREARERALREQLALKQREEAKRVPTPKQPIIAHTITGLDLNLTQINAYKWLMVAIARSICPDFRVIPEQAPALNRIFNYCMGIRTDDIDPDRGLWIYGNVGTGKSTLLEVVRVFGQRMRSTANKNYVFRITPAVKIAGEYTNNGYPALNTYVDARYQAFDDVGNEPEHLRFYGSDGEPMTYILTMRYGHQRKDDFTHITTNMSMQEIRQRYGFRVADRLFEMFNIIHLPGTSLRGS